MKKLVIAGMAIGLILVLGACGKNADKMMDDKKPASTMSGDMKATPTPTPMMDDKKATPTPMMDDKKATPTPMMDAK
jgi:hypothetical protein